MLKLMSRRRAVTTSEPEVVTRTDRALAVVRIALVALLALRLARALRRVPSDIALVRKAPSPTTA